MRKEKQGRRSGTPTDEPMMDINTTPLIDVMLVLLIMLISSPSRYNCTR